MTVQAQILELIKLLQDEGKIHHIGLSEVTVAELQEAQQTAEIVSVQNLYNLAPMVRSTRSRARSARARRNWRWRGCCGARR